MDEKNTTLIDNLDIQKDDFTVKSNGSARVVLWSAVQLGVVDFSKMDEKNITLIDNLDIQKDDFTVKVIIIRLWSQPLFKDPEQLYSIEMILMDEEGSKIHANVLQKWIQKFKKLLHEGAAIFIKNPTICSTCLQIQVN
ncbi:hypothetical protein OSB04_007114 [Centaurea solstitialis]|uniref:Replication protein A 70 kDa DNA-binding subunit B/D first OB fold domain-containing protein n=1 Tax=Centaurea solstitialis TaxID=347529 RepID=A0AA38TL17_9ASTR|nr:hypothetical protein OSB04_007114 [Centaurea solstitialis]